MTLRFGSLFSGIGGFDLGFERAGMECAWQCEIDKHARKVLAHHWPEVRCYDDVRSITAGDVPVADGRNDALPNLSQSGASNNTGTHSRRVLGTGGGKSADTYPSGLPRVDLICGGFPCQDVSVAGRRAGLAGERSGLWFEFRRVIEELRPSWVVVENVPGLLSSNGGRDMGTILGGLGDLGYRWAYGVLDAQWFGVAQRRRRVFIVGSLGDERCLDVLPLPEGMCGDTPSRGAAGEGVAGDVAPSLTGSGRGTARVGESRGQDPIIVDLQQVTSAANRSRELPISPTMSPQHQLTTYAIQDSRAMEKAQGGLGVREGGPMYTLDSTGAQGVYVPDIVPNAMSSKWAKGAGGPAGDEIQNVVSQGRPRRLTPRECERLQGFPDDWTAGQADTHRYKQLGNAVVVPVAEWIGRRIVEVSQH